MAWITQTPVDLETFDPTFTGYTAAELDAYATAMLKQDMRENGNVGNVLLEEHLASRRRREWPVDATQIDGELTKRLKKSDRPVDASGDGQMMYNRTHPKGRKVNSREQRSRNGASFYR